MNNTDVLSGANLLNCLKQVIHTGGNMPVNPAIQQQLLYTQKRRQIEYFVLMTVQGFFFGAFLRNIDTVAGIGVVIFTVGLTYSLTQAREKRRILPESNKYRVLADVIEMIGLLFVLVCATIAAIDLHIPVFFYQAHASLCLLLYFGCTMLFELFWTRKNFQKLLPAQQLNYLSNYNRSIIFPKYLLRFRKIFFKK
ncbi:MAG: hypothetical protein U0Y96_09675 [Candidatus Kapaibacterium sp.]